MLILIAVLLFAILLAVMPRRAAKILFMLTLAGVGCFVVLLVVFARVDASTDHLANLHSYETQWAAHKGNF